jgi:hypothetical protein
LRVRRSAKPSLCFLDGRDGGMLVAGWVDFPL